ncbi:MAG TPA: RtcB family protein [Opitutus sp.]|nr:RtcB family protein [Opitutus sp.]
MSMEIKARDLIAAGWRDERQFGAVLKRARELQATGLDVSGVLAALEADYPKEAKPAELRPQPAAFTEAVAAETPAEVASVAASRARMTELLHVPVVKRGALMPDTCPAGAAPATIPVGGAIEVENALLPGAHSADICCSMFATFFADNHPIAELMDKLWAATHFGAGGRPRGKQMYSTLLEEPVWDNQYLSGLQARAREFLGTQGDGNHFAYIGRVEFTEEQHRAIAQAGHAELAHAIERRDGAFQVLVTHHGSRGLGADLYKRGMIAATEWTRRNATSIPLAAAWLPADSPEGRDYWAALQYVARWTRVNHASIHDEFLHRVGLRPLAQFGNEHNFVWRRGDSFYHGKGATPAWRDEEGRPLLGLIPLNMAREILIVLGGDNDEFLSFAPHGAGRNLSRKAMLAPFRDADGDIEPARIKQVMAETTGGLDIRWYNGAPDLSESPLGYKDATKVKAQIERFALARVAGEIQPLGCIMAGEAPEPAWMKKKREQRASSKAARREWLAENEE